jgi:hypothetical protein
LDSAIEPKKKVQNLRRDFYVLSRPSMRSIREIDFGAITILFKRMGQGLKRKSDHCLISSHFIKKSHSWKKMNFNSRTEQKSMVMDNTSWLLFINIHKWEKSNSNDLMYFASLLMTFYIGPQSEILHFSQVQFWSCSCQKWKINAILFFYCSKLIF